MVVMMMVTVFVVIVTFAVKRDQAVVPVELRTEERPEAVGSQESDKEEGDALQAAR